MMEVLKVIVPSLIIPILTLLYTTSFSNGFPLTFPTICQPNVISSSFDGYIVQNAQKDNEGSPVIFVTQRQLNETSNWTGIVWEFNISDASVQEIKYNPHLELPSEKDVVVVVNEKIFTALLWSISVFTFISSGALIIWAMIYWEGSPWYRQRPKIDEESGSIYSEKSFGKTISCHQQQKLLVVRNISEKI